MPASQEPSREQIEEALKWFPKAKGAECGTLDFRYGVVVAAAYRAQASDIEDLKAALIEAAVEKARGHTGQSTCGHNGYWIGAFGGCMACRAEKAEAALAEKSKECEALRADKHSDQIGYVGIISQWQDKVAAQYSEIAALSKENAEFKEQAAQLSRLLDRSSYGGYTARIEKENAALSEHARVMREALEKIANTALMGHTAMDNQFQDWSKEALSLPQPGEARSKEPFFCCKDQDDPCHPIGSYCSTGRARLENKP